MSPAAFLDAATAWALSPGINRAREDRRAAADRNDDEREDT